MGYKSSIAKIAAGILVPEIYKEQKLALSIQQNMLMDFLQQAQHTQFGSAHHFSAIGSYDEFKSAVSVRDYEDFKDYIELISDGKRDVLWKGRPLYFCKSSGTTSGTKYIPATKEQILEMIRAARNSL